ncbi:LuxR C-terminal-related transcriptional regulator [Mesorhizobium sp. AaZ16]
MHGKSAWDVSQILGSSKRTVTLHRGNAKATLGGERTSRPSDG